MSEAIDILEIITLKHKYGRYIDNNEYEKWRGLFAEDGTFGRAGADPFVGEEELREFNHKVFEETYSYSAHFLANPIIEVNSDTATGEWYLFLLYELTDGTTGWKAAEYTDEYVKVDGEWLIDSTIVSFGSEHEIGGVQVTQ